MANRIEYQLVGRYKDGAKVVGYHLNSTESDKSGRKDPLVFAYLVGRGSVTNVKAQLNGEEILYRTVSGIDITDLPVYNESKGEASKLDAVGHVRRKDTAEDIMNKVNIVCKIKTADGKYGFRLQNLGGGTKDFSYKTTWTMARQGKIGNASAQLDRGTPLLRGVGLNLKALETVEVEVTSDQLA